MSGLVQAPSSFLTLAQRGQLFDKIQNNCDLSVSFGTMLYVHVNVLAFCFVFTLKGLRHIKCGFMSILCIVYCTENAIRPFNYLELKLECLWLFYVLGVFRKSCFKK